MNKEIRDKIVALLEEFIEELTCKDYNVDEITLGVPVGNSDTSSKKIDEIRKIILSIQD